MTLTVTHDGREVQTWPAYMFLGGTEQFRVLKGDLDLDGRAELVVARISSVSNGLGVRYWTVSILDGTDWSRPPLEFQVEEFSAADSFRRANEHEPCAFVVTEWCTAVDRRRGEGTYLVGQRFRYRNGQLMVDSTRPIVMRRLFYSFADDMKQDGPGTWLASFKTEVRARHPIQDGPVVREFSGTIVDVKGRRVVLQSHASPPTTLALDEDSWGLESDKGYSRFGVLGSGRPFPPAYAPSATHLKGRRAVVISYPDRNERIIWLVPRNAAGREEGGAPSNRDARR